MVASWRVGEVANVSLYGDDFWGRMVVPQFGQMGKMGFLNLSGCGLYTIPEEVYRLPNLRLLDLSRNALTQLPEKIAELKDLIELILSENRLTVLPPEIGQLRSLQRLYVSGNRLISLPRELCEIEGLRILALGRNRLPPNTIDWYPVKLRLRHGTFCHFCATPASRA